MLIATTVMLFGLLAGIVASQLGGYRLGGVVVVPFVAVYLLWNFGTFPVFVTSTVAAYVSLHYIKTRLPLYGRPLFVLSNVVGTRGTCRPSRSDGPNPDRQPSIPSASESSWVSSSRLRFALTS